MTTTTPTSPQGRSWRLARVTAPGTAVLAGRRFFPLWAVVHHRGRKSGRALTVPVAVLATPDTFLITLPWGPGTNWVKNVLAAGGCRVRWKGRDHLVVRPEVVDAVRARPYFNRVSWFIAQKAFTAETFLLLHRQD